jgi:hypothetical protein
LNGADRDGRHNAKGHQQTGDHPRTETAERK